MKTQMFGLQCLISPLIISALYVLIYEILIFLLLLRVVFCCAFRHCTVLSSLNIVTSDSASQISISSDQRSIGDASDIATLQEECIAFGKYTFTVLSCYIHFHKNHI